VLVVPVAGVLESVVVAVEGAAAAAFTRAVATGFKTIMLEELDAIEVINMALFTSVIDSFQFVYRQTRRNLLDRGGLRTGRLLGSPVRRPRRAAISLTPPHNSVIL
jgi:hypothetical protein